MVNPNTVAQAYLELERAGVVVKRHGSGTFVSDAGSPLARKERLKILAKRADTLLAESAQMGVPLDELLSLIKSRGTTLQSSKKP